MKMIGLARLGRDCELRTTQSGEPVATLSLAFNYGRKGEDGKRPSEWIRASLWGQRANSLAEYLVKGAQIEVVLSDPHIETFTKQDGTVSSSLTARIDDIEFAGSPQQQGQQQAPRQQAPQQGYSQQPRQQAPQGQAPRQAAPQQRQAAPQRQQPQGGGGSGFDDMDDDIPFVSASMHHDMIDPIARRMRKYVY